jgi:CheY-like chemotaxis protein
MDHSQKLQVLMVEDNPGDVELTRECLAEGKVRVDLHVAADGLDALAFLRRETPHQNAPRPDLILLDLNLPKMNGREVLETIKADDGLKQIPVVVLTSSAAEEDIARTYRLHANCYVQKPVDLERFMSIITAIDEFWFNVVSLPTRS